MFRYFAGWIEDQRAPDQITHALADIIRFRLLVIAAGYEDGNDANGLRVDPIFKMALDLSPSDLPDRERVRRVVDIELLCAWELAGKTRNKDRTSRASRPARRRASRPRRRKARRAASRSSSTGPPAGDAS